MLNFQLQRTLYFTFSICIFAHKGLASPLQVHQHDSSLSEAQFEIPESAVHADNEPETSDSGIENRYDSLRRIPTRLERRKVVLPPRPPVPPQPPRPPGPPPDSGYGNQPGGSLPGFFIIPPGYWDTWVISPSGYSTITPPPNSRYDCIPYVLNFCVNNYVYSEAACQQALLHFSDLNSVITGSPETVLQTEQLIQKSKVLCESGYPPPTVDVPGKPNEPGVPIPEPNLKPYHLQIMYLGTEEILRLIRISRTRGS